MRLTERAGTKQGRLAIVEYRSADGRWLCRCDCGRSKWITSCQLARGTRSCGCLAAEIARAGHTLHGISRSTEWRSWYGAVFRTTNPKCKSWEAYGGRGIKMAPEWMGAAGFLRFLAHVGPKPTPRHSIDRINNNGNYEPGNVRWATGAEQSANQRPRNRRGSMNSRAKLDEVSVECLRVVFSLRIFGQCEVAHWWGVSRTVVGQVVTGKSWRHVGGPLTRGRIYARLERLKKARRA